MHDLRLTGTVLFIRDLGRSISFYRELLELEVLDTSPTAALLACRSGTHLVLRAAGPQAAHPLGGLGYQYVLWTVTSMQDLQSCEQKLRQQSAFRETRKYGSITTVEGRDPDDLVVLIGYADPDGPPLREIPSRIYAW